jgi:hypothetical protein
LTERYTARPVTTTLLLILILLGALGLTGLVQLAQRAYDREIQKEQDRQAALDTWATLHGWTIVRRPPNVDWAARLPGGRPRGVSMVVSGQIDGRAVAIAQYQYAERGADPDTHHYVVTTTRLSRPGPSLTVRYRDWAIRSHRRPATPIGFAPFDDEYVVVTREICDRSSPRSGRGPPGPAHSAVESGWERTAGLPSRAARRAGYDSG